MVEVQKWDKTQDSTPSNTAVALWSSPVVYTPSVEFKQGTGTMYQNCHGSFYQSLRLH